jgi:hypothetical protein
MALAIFDLDNKLLSGDSDDLFGQFLVEKNWSIVLNMTARTIFSPTIYQSNT